MYTRKHTHKPETLRLSTDTGSRLLLLQIILIPILYCAQVMRGLIFRGAFRRQESEVRVSLNPAVDVHWIGWSSPALRRFCLQIGTHNIVP